MAGGAVNAPLRKRGSTLIAVGLAVQLGAAVVVKSVEHPSAIGVAAVVVMMIATAIYMTGFAYVAKAKARSAWWCLLGLFSLFGLTMLMALPDYDFD